MILARVFTGIGDRANPILVKEIRQALKSRFFIVSFSFMLAVCVAITLILLGSYDPQEPVWTGRGRAAGPILIGLSAIKICLGFAAYFLVPTFAFYSVMHEVNRKTYELLMITTMKPRQIVLGKLLSAVLQLMLFYSAAIPFIATIYLLGGVDVFSLLLMIAWSFLGAVILSLWSVFVALAVRNRRARNFWYVLNIMLLGFVATMLTTGLLGIFIFEGITHMFRSLPRFWFAMGVALVLYALVFWHLLAIAISCTTFRSDNRTTRLRWLVLGTWAITTAIFVAACIFFGNEPEAWTVYAIILLFYLAIAGLIFSSESNRLSLRVARGYPRSLLGRAWAGLMYPGGVRGFWFFVTMMALVFAVMSIGQVLADFFSGTSYSGRENLFAYGLACYAVAYIGIPHAVLAFIFGRRLRGGYTAIICGGCFFLGSIAPHILDFRRWRYERSATDLFSPWITLSSERFLENHFLILLVVAIFALLLNVFHLPKAFGRPTIPALEPSPPQPPPGPSATPRSPDAI